jgi:hypothetical protein
MEFLFLEVLAGAQSHLIKAGRISVFCGTNVLNCKTGLWLRSDPLAVVGSFVVAALFYRLIKSPFLMVKRRFSAVPQPADASFVSPQLLAGEQLPTR